MSPFATVLLTLPALASGGASTSSVSLVERPGASACGTPAFAEEFSVVAPMGHLRGDGARKVAHARALPDRDAWGLYPNYRVSEHFIAKWGNVGDVTQDEVAFLLDAFETAWAVEVEEMGHPEPDGSGTYLFNVYIGDTGDGTPSGYGAGGYYNRDADGFPMIVIARDSLRYRDYVQETAPHEFYHALQDEVASYPYTGDSAWYWEATAEWAAGESLPDNATYAQFLFGYAYNAQLSVEFFDYPDEGLLSEYHQYGAFIFPRFVSEVVADRDAVVASWVAPQGASPLASLRAELADRGVALEDAFGDFAARNATWNYVDGDVYRATVRDYVAYYPGEGHELAEVDARGTDGFVQPAADEQPRQWAYNVVKMRLPRDGVDIAVQTDAEGSAGSAAEWRVQVVTEDGTTTPVERTDGVGSLRVRAGSEAWLVAAAVPRTARPDERFAWAWSITPAPAPEDTEVDTDEDLAVDVSGDDVVEDKSGGCASSPARGTGVLGLTLGATVALLRRRRPFTP